MFSGQKALDDPVLLENYSLKQSARVEVNQLDRSKMPIEKRIPLGDHTGRKRHCARPPYLYTGKADYHRFSYPSILLPIWLVPK